jgi:hypothetical protein
MHTITKLLSKTKLLRGYRCPKYLYLTVHRPELETPIDAATQALFDQGHRVGEAARKHYAGGILVHNKAWDFSGALAKTRELIANQTPILYEAAFEYKGCYARADILQYNAETKRYTIIEVKSSTKMKSEHVQDVGLQTWIMAKSGLPIEKILLAHLNKNCCYPDLNHLFTEVDVTALIREHYLSIQPKIHYFFSLLQQPQEPEIDIGPHCLSPTPCSFMHYCWAKKNIPELSIFNLPNIKNKQWELYKEGIIHLQDARLTELSPLQTRMIECDKTNTRFIDKKTIQQTLSTWQFPLTFLDFETINPAIPRYDYCGPFQHVPFQFSVHTWTAPDAPITHTDFLYEFADDPRPALIPALLKACGTQGSIVAYYSPFEIERIQALATYSIEHQAALNQLVERMVDPLPLIRESVYDNAFAGPASV